MKKIVLLAKKQHRILDFYLFLFTFFLSRDTRKRVNVLKYHCVIQAPIYFIIFGSVKKKFGNKKNVESLMLKKKSSLKTNCCFLAIFVMFKAVVQQF